MTERSLLPQKTADWGWFSIDGTRKFRQVRTLTGDPSWTQGLNPKKLEVQLNGRITPAGRVKTLLASKQDVLAFRKPVGASQIIVIANGSFLLNLPLINHENRKLAGALVNEVGPPEKYVVFLEAGGSPYILDKDPVFEQPSFTDYLEKPPLRYLLFHLLILFVLACFWGWPTFGFVRDEGARRAPDFGEHIDALGKLLQATGDEAYARSRLSHYQQTTRSDRGNLSAGAPTGRV